MLVIPMTFLLAFTTIEKNTALHHDYQHCNWLRSAIDACESVNVAAARLTLCTWNRDRLAQQPRIACLPSETHAHAYVAAELRQPFATTACESLNNALSANNALSELRVRIPADLHPAKYA